LGIKQVDIIAHSNAAPFIVPVIKEHPQNVHKLILLSPAGVHPEMNPFLAVLKLWQKERRNKKDKRQLERLGLLKPDEKPYSKNWRCYYPEAAVTATRVITEDLENLIRGGLDAVVVILTQDSLFRRKDYLANLDPRIVKMVELPGYHSQARFDPTIGNRLACLLKD
jgi:pimeloyl-ACP methyl ester carboxylesterase